MLCCRGFKDLSFTHGACKQYNQHPSLAHRKHPRLVLRRIRNRFKTHSSFQCRCYRCCFFIQGCYNPRFWTCATYLTIALPSNYIKSYVVDSLLSQIEDRMNSVHASYTSIQGLQWMSPVTSQKQVDGTHYSKSKSVYSKPPQRDIHCKTCPYPNQFVVWLFDVEATVAIPSLAQRATSITYRCWNSGINIP